ncbi:hypothetical protein GQ53DRAFT_238657 [Thozetella sp. PMI_491]|nr:hypothetical protein GQ53DRAFT_238657 [Thozetella sp. PMI_491]
MRNIAIFTGLMAMTASVLADAVGVAERQDPGVTFCTDAHYESWEPCDNESIPTFGAGACASLHLEPGICYNWSSFPDVNVAPLVNNVTFVYVPCCTSAITSCDLYTTTDCTGDKGYAGPGETGLDCQEPAFNDRVNSFICST